AIRRCAGVVDLLEKGKITVLRCGLHPSEGLLTGRDILAGPFHESFGQMVATYRYGKLLTGFLKKEKARAAIKNILFNPLDAADVIGYKRVNAGYLEALLKRDKVFRVSACVEPKSVIVEYADGSRRTLNVNGEKR
ncbi:MAG: hypothetical protein WCG78_06535, partial [Candidatus Omnitrophota bacterium]